MKTFFLLCTMEPGWSAIYNLVQAARDTRCSQWQATGCFQQNELTTLQVEGEHNIYAYMYMYWTDMSYVCQFRWSPVLSTTGQILKCRVQPTVGTFHRLAPTRCIWVDEAEFIKEQWETRPNEIHITRHCGVWGLVVVDLSCAVQRRADASGWLVPFHSNALLTANAAEEDVHALTWTPPFANHSVFLT